jgi:hypothetical protein
MMLEALMGERLRVYRIKSRTKEGKIRYEEVTEEGEPLILRAKVERSAVRSYSQGQVEKTGDASAVFKERDDGVPEEDDLLVTPRGETFKVVRIETDTLLGSGVGYVRATLALTRAEVPSGAHTGA